MAAHSGPPDSDEIEVTLLGRGEGESCLVHLGNHHWLIVDSFLEPVATPLVINGVPHPGTVAEPAALVYLRDLYSPGPLPPVMAVVLTHFHADHYKGIVELHKVFPGARFVVPDAVSVKKFMASLNDDSTKELSRIGDHIELTGASSTATRSMLRRAVVTMTLIPDTKGLGREVLVMAPLHDAKNEIANAVAGIAAGEPATEYERVLNDENCSSIALYVRACGSKILLGGDVVNSPARFGWPAVLAEEFNDRPKVDLVKVPHHGADTAHHVEMWTKLVVDGAPMLVAPFWNKTRPRWADQVRLDKLGPLYQTGPSARRWSTEWAPVVAASAQTGRVTARRRDGADDWTYSVGGTGHLVDPPPTDPTAAPPP